MLKHLTVWITTNWGKFFKRWEYQITLSASWEICMQDKKQQLELDVKQQVQNWKGVHQGCILSPCLFNLYAGYIMWNAGVVETQAGIQTAGRNINNLRYADDTTLRTESEELRSLLLRVKEESRKAGLKLNIQKTDYGILSHHLMANRGGNSGNSVRLYFGGLQNHWWLQPWN